MGRYLAGRLAQGAVVLWATFTIAFILLQLLPGDAILIKFLNPDFGLSPEQLAEIRTAYGADTPVWTQYLATVWNFVTGDFGYSIQAGVPVAQLVATNLPATLLLAAFALAAAIVLAFLLAYLSSFAPFAWLRGVFAAAPSLLVSIPVFWLGIMLIQFFSFRLKLVPVINPGPWEALILPTAALAVPIAAPLAQVLMRNIDAVSLQPFVPVARAKGASRHWVFWKHVLRNALLPTLTIAGILFGEILAGAVVTETVFGLSGLGSLTYKAVNNQDGAVLQAVVVISAAIFVAITLLVDLVTPLLDPRLRAGRGA
ncbi:ABC transporter permease [Acetobacteraceae bacterium H6797]|nr:ABC transporter permease [Acetobacteraceae bacterium H6797]